MAYIADTAFEQRVSNHEFDSMANITGKFVDGNGDADECSAGFLCTKDELLPCEGYETIYNNENSWQMVAATSSNTEHDAIYACNTGDVAYATNAAAGTAYKMGINTLGLSLPAGDWGTFTRIDFEGEGIYRIGAGNTSGTIGTNEYFTIDAGLFKTAAAVPATAGTPYFTLLGTGVFTEGVYAGFTYYDVQAHIA
jgi:hypothetical protein